MALLAASLGAVCLLLAAYLFMLHKQLRSINDQLVRRAVEGSRQPVSLELINSELNRLAAHINECLKAEESARLESQREEKRFKELIANISHDLRTPLTAIKGYQQLMMKGELTAGQQEKLLVAQKHADVLGNLIEQFFEYSYLVSSESQLQLVRLNATELVTECLAAAVDVFEERGLMIQLEEAPDLHVLADYEMTVRIMQNLIRNSAMHASGDITVKLSSQDGYAIITFSNPLVNPAVVDAARLFERFYTGDPARRRSTGLGLHIVKLLAEQMGGRTGAAIHDHVIDIWIELPLYN